jgi:hypothetical protein
LDQRRVYLCAGEPRLTNLKSNISTAITIGSVVGTIFLIWIAISQVGMLVYGWSLLVSNPKDDGSEMKRIR